MSTILSFLGSDHRACDAVIASAEEAVAGKNRGSARTLFERFHTATAHHLATKENVLFPALEARTGNTMRPTQIMRMEHAQMRDLMQATAQPRCSSRQP